MHTTLTCAPAHAIQVPGQSVTKQTELLNVGLKLQPVVRDVVLGLEEARDEPKNWVGSSHFPPFSYQPVTSLSLIISFQRRSNNMALKILLSLLEGFLTCPSGN